jgi:hypothetical protein
MMKELCLDKEMGNLLRVRHVSVQGTARCLIQVYFLRKSEG